MKVRQLSWSPVGGRAGPRRQILIRRAAYVPTLAYVRLADDSVVPSLADIKDVIETIRDDRRVATLRTSALFPRTADQFASAGFTAADTLRLLRADLASAVLHRAIAAQRRSRVNIGTMRRWNYGAAARGSTEPRSARRGDTMQPSSTTSGTPPRSIGPVTATTRTRC